MNDVMILRLYCFKVLAGFWQWLKLFCLFIDTKEEVLSNPVEQRSIYTKQLVTILEVFMEH
jgi:hypothetical protein